MFLQTVFSTYKVIPIDISKVELLPSIITIAGVKDFKEFCLHDIKSHNNKDDCWVTIKGNVYDITKFIPDHPDEEIIK